MAFQILELMKSKQNCRTKEIDQKILAGASAVAQWVNTLA